MLLKSGIFAGILCAFFTHDSTAQIRNGYFDQWKTFRQSEPAGWHCEGKTDFSIRLGADSALQLWNSKTDKSVASAYFSRDPSDLVPAPGFPVSYTPDSVLIAYKSNLNADTASITIGFTKSGETLPLILENISIFGNTDWQLKAFPLEYVGASAGLIADSAFLMISSSDPVFGPFSDGSIQIDYIQFKTGSAVQANFTNHSFQKWQYTSVLYPEYWHTHHLDAILYQKNENLTSFSNDIFGGSGSLHLQGIKVQSFSGNEDTLPGYAISMKSNVFNLNNKSADANEPSFSVSQRYNSIRGKVWTNLENDQFTAMVNFFHSDTIVGSAYYFQNQSTSGWEEFSEDIEWMPGFIGNPDSASVQLIVSDSSFERINSLNSWAKIDELSLDNYFTGIGNSVQNTIRISPNPIKNQLNISNPNGGEWTGTIFSHDGKKIIEFTSQENHISIPFTNVNAGIYYLQIQSSQQTNNYKILYTP